MKKILLTTIILLFTVLIGHSQTVGDTFTENYITYTVTSVTPNTVETSGYDTNGGTILDIPAIVINTLIPYNVTAIGDYTFENKGLTSVTIPDGVTDIGISSFNSNNLTTVTIPDSVVSLGSQAFATNSLTNITIGNNVSTIAIGAFIDNDLTNITIPSSVTDIGLLAFFGNPLVSVTSLATIAPTIITGTNDTFALNRSSINLTIPAGTSATYVTDSGALWTGFNSVTENLIVGDTYTENYITYEVTSISPNIVEAIDYNAAGGASVTIPTTISNGLITYDVTEIGELAFDAKGLTNVTFTTPTNVTVIGQQAFRSNLLSSFVIPNGITVIGIQAFLGNQLTTSVIPNGVISIGQEAFYGNQLTSISIPDSVTVIGGNAFAFNQLSSVVIPTGLTTIELGIFQHNQITTVLIPSNITTIGAAAFENNLLTSITIPNSITLIAARAFKDNPLTSVISEGTTPPTIITQNAIYDTFAIDRSGIDLTIPAGTSDVYVTNAGALWTGFNTVTEAGTLNTTDFELTNTIKLLTTTNSIKVTYSNTIKLQKHTIYNISGAEIATGIENEIPTNTFTSGIYILKLDFDKGTSIKKILVN